MFASYIEMKMQPGKMTEAKVLTNTLEPEIKALGVKQFLLIDKGNDEALGIAIYETAAQQEAAAEGARAVISKYSEMFSAPPERKQVEVTHNFQQP